MPKDKREYKVIGLMSGTSLDGLDICYAKFTYKDEQWSFKILATKTYAYSSKKHFILSKATTLSGIQLTKLDITIAHWYAEKLTKFMSKFDLKKADIDFIASHGQTIFHKPEKQLTLQIGCGTTLSSLLKVPVINNFRALDVANGGQGAPLVPIGDLHLFNSFADSFVNIGGFANMTHLGKEVKAFDICPVNSLLNPLSGKFGQSYDEDGKIAKSGKINDQLLENLNAIETYQDEQPTSLGYEWNQKHVWPLITKYDKESIEDIIATITEHAAIQISKRLEQFATKKAYFTGGGTYNTHLLKRIKKHFTGEVIVPDDSIIEFKEALIFGFLGVLYMEDQPNCLKSVTGAKRNVRGGVLHLPK